MTFICYQPKNFSSKHLQIIAQCNHVIEEYERKGHVLTIRQIFYQGVSRDWWRNTQNMYQSLVGILTDARMAGVVSWTAIEDRGRALMGINTVDGPPQAGEKMLRDYALDLWANQDWRPEVWPEKQALQGVIGNICDKLRVDYFPTKGYSSISETWRAGRRLSRYIQKGQRPIIFHLGDHDPSGIDMTRHVAETLSTFVGMPIMVQRLALNMDQVEQYDPPPNPLKLRADGEYSDSRAKSYVEHFGDSSWELDALNPETIEDLIRNAVLSIRDEDKWDEMEEEETTDKRVMADMLEERYGKPKEDNDDQD